MSEQVDIYFFLGIGGIGMSALARHLHQQGKTVIGYDKTSTALTTQLELEGISIGYIDHPNELPQLLHVLPTERVMVVFTPAIPADSRLKNWFTERGYRLVKRSELLGKITAGAPTIAIAGTHGKTTTSAITAHVLHASGFGCNAFLGGIPANYGSNHISGGPNNWFVVEADEFDRSFLTLTPRIAAITSMDADHLDIYEHADALRTAFEDFAHRTERDGLLLVCDRVQQPVTVDGLRVYTYGFNNEADYRIAQSTDAPDRFSLRAPDGQTITDLPAPMPGRHNLENTTVAVAIALELGIDVTAIRQSLGGFRGIRRRFEYQANTGKTVFIDDYAHHPEELRAIITSVRERHPGKRITGIFQPHLFSRTRDFGDGFADSLGLLDEVLLLEIYPARELPIPGIDSQWLLDKIPNPAKKRVAKSQLLPLIRERVPEVLLTLGAGDIDREVEPIRRLLETLHHEEETNR